MERLDRTPLPAVIHGMLIGLCVLQAGGKGSVSASSSAVTAADVLPPERRTTWNPGIPGGRKSSRGREKLQPRIS